MAGKKKSRSSFFIGILAIFFAIVGVVTVVKFAVSGISAIADKTLEKKRYETFLAPVAMIDIDPFDDISTADVPQLVNCAIWALSLDKSSNTTYEEYVSGDKVGMLIPQSDVEQNFRKLFGKEIDIASKHSTIDMTQYDIYYDAAVKGYIIPITGIESAYIPKVYSIKTKGSSDILSVGYISSVAWADIVDGAYTDPEPDKYMEVTVRMDADGNRYIASLKTVDGQEVAGEITTVEHHEPEVTEPLTVPEDVQVTAAPEMPSEPVTDENGNEVTTEPVTDENGNEVTAAAEETTAGETTTL